MAEANQWVHGLKTMAVGPAAESLAQENDPTGTEWDVTGDMADDTSNVTYTHSTGVGTLTQPSAKLTITGVASVPYRFTYTLSALTTPENATMTITTAFASVAVNLPLVAGLNTVDFTSAVGAATGDFVISVVSTGAAIFTLDTMTLTHGSAEAMTTRSRLEVLDFTIRAEADNTGTITVVDDAHSTVGIPLNAGDVASWSAQDFQDTLNIKTLFFRASVDTDGFHWQYRS